MTQCIERVNVSTVLAGREDDAADRDTVRLLHAVTQLRAQLRTLEPQLSKAITEYGLRRGQSGYREFFLRNELNYKEHNNVR
jgi:hypothetical protein